MTNQTPRIGPRMHAAVAYVRMHPGCPKMHPARYCGPNRSLQYGYRTVNRAIKAGLLRTENGPRGSYRLFVAENLP